MCSVNHTSITAAGIRPLLLGAGPRFPMDTFFFNDPATTEIYTLSLHDALPISTLVSSHSVNGAILARVDRAHCSASRCRRDRKSTRLNSSHANISYAVFCL